MKLMIEIRDGKISNLTSTEEISIFIIDHDELVHGGIMDEGELEASRESVQPDCIYWDEADFDEAVSQALAEYESVEIWEMDEVRT
jgi:hypothetical protein